MATVKHHKVVAALPAELEPDAIYYVRAGAGYDQYVTNHSGVIVPYPLNAPSAAASFFGLVTVTASATGQTEFAIPGGYTPGAIVVFLNGASLAPVHYAATDGATVVLASGAGVVPGTELVVLRLSAFEVADALPLGGTAADSSKLGGTLAAEFYQRSNILGTVSQSGGAPTGAIIERGSNANGEYVRYADGTQICWSKKITNSELLAGRSVSLNPGSPPAFFVGDFVLQGGASLFAGLNATGAQVYGFTLTIDSAPYAFNQGRNTGEYFSFSMGTTTAQSRITALTWYGRWY